MTEETESVAIWPLLDWLEQVDSISCEQRDIYKLSTPLKFFEDLKDGTILSKVAIFACPEKANECSRAVSSENSNADINSLDR